MQKKRIMLVVGAVLLLAALVAVFFRGAGNPVSSDVLLTRVFRAGEATPLGDVSVYFTEDGAQYRFVNIAIDLDQDGTIAAYTAGAAQQEEWLVKNASVDVRQGAPSSRYRVGLLDATVDGLQDISAVVVVSDDPLETWDGTVGKRTGVLANIPFVGTRDIEARVVRDRETQKDTAGMFTVRSASAHSHSTANEPAGMNVRVDDPFEGSSSPTGYVNIQFTGVNDTPQEFNECAPTAASNALDWLADIYDLEDQMPTDTEGLIDELKGDMDWDGGVAPGDSLPGIEDFISRHNLPFEAHLIEPSDNLFDVLVAEMQRGQILLISMQYYEKDDEGEWKLDGAHLATVVGLSGGVSGFPNFVHFHDSGDGEDVPSKDLQELRGSEFASDYEPDHKTEVRYVIAISPVRDETGALISSDMATGVGTTGGTSSQTATTSRSAFSFFSVTFNPVGDHFVGETFPVRVQVTKTGENQYIFWGGESLRVEAGNPWTIEGRFSASGTVRPDDLQDQPPTTTVGGGVATYTINGMFTCASAGAASITYHPTLGWQQVFNKDPIPEVIAETYGDQLEPTDTMSVTSPPFTCKATLTMITETASQTALDRRATFCPGVETVYAGEDAREIRVFKEGDECYPDFQFRVAGADACTQDHYHAASENTVYSLAGVPWVDPNRPECGYGPEGSLDSETVAVSETLLVQYLGGVFSN